MTSSCWPETDVVMGGGCCLNIQRDPSLAGNLKEKKNLDPHNSGRPIPTAIQMCTDTDT